MSDDDEEAQAGENSDEAKKAGQQSDPNGHDKKDDWDLAIRFRDIQRYGYLEPKQKKEMSEKAIRSILIRARESLGPVQRPYRYQTLTESEAEARRAEGAVMELDIEETLHQHFKGSPITPEPVYQVRTEKNHGLVLLLDTSLSMKGEKLALLGVTVAAVLESIPSDAL